MMSTRPDSSRRISNKKLHFLTDRLQEVAPFVSGLINEVTYFKNREHPMSKIHLFRRALCIYIIVYRRGHVAGWKISKFVGKNRRMFSRICCIRLTGQAIEFVS